jgi:hypothetical protein
VSRYRSWGHAVGQGGVEMQQRKVQVLAEWPRLIEPWTRVRTLHHVYLTSRVHVFPPLVHGYISRDYTRAPELRHLYSTFGQVILHVATLHHTNFSPHIRYIITSAFV